MFSLVSTQMGCSLMHTCYYLSSDLDTIDVSNLNRQFLFRAKDVGRSKAETAAEFIMNRIPGCTVVPHMGKIQDFDEDFYRQFQIVVSGLDNIEARRWLNSVLVGMVSGQACQLTLFCSVLFVSSSDWRKAAVSRHIRVSTEMSSCHYYSIFF